MEVTFPPELLSFAGVSACARVLFKDPSSPLEKGWSIEGLDEKEELGKSGKRMVDVRSGRRMVDERSGKLGQLKI